MAKQVIYKKVDKATFLTIMVGRSVVGTHAYIIACEAWNTLKAAGCKIVQR